jgi:UDP-hydrolysing UDP-N-acetyl-D-glucosamine 2-epimerase
MRKIAIITGSRADGSPLSSVIKHLGKHAFVIRTQGLHGHETALLSILKQTQYDLLVLLGDRFETLIAGAIASLLKLPIAHIHGGDFTPNMPDEKFRNAISKLATYHFPACKLHADRLIAMGVEADKIFVCGAPGVDLLEQPRLTSAELEEEFGIKIQHPFALVCYHPEMGETSMDWAAQLQDYASVVITGANADPGGDKINEFWKTYQHQNCIYKKTIPQKQWMSLMHEADALLGNSSGFVFEGLTLGKKVVMIGNRQQGRYEDALELFKNDWQHMYPFGKPGEVGKKIAETLLSIEIPRKQV